MANKQSFGLPLAALLLAGSGALIGGPALGQTPGIRNLLRASSTASFQAFGNAADPHESAAVRLPGSKAPASPVELAIFATKTAAPGDARLDRMLLLLKPSAAQERALTAELENLQNSPSADYHHWLTPAEFAGRYANSPANVAAVSTWLTSQGFQVAPAAAGRGWIEFSGSVAEVQRAFHTQVNSVETARGARFVLADEISIPAALAPFVEGVVSLDGVVAAPTLAQPLPVNGSVAEVAEQKLLRQAEAFTPRLFGQVLHLDPMQNSSTNGAGQTIAIAARSNVNASDVAAFRAVFGLPVSALKVVSSGSSPPSFEDDQAEATMAASWAGAVAPAAQVVLVPVSSTNATDGLDLSLAAIVDESLAHTVAIGYSTCEAALSPAHEAFYASLYRQAAAEGVTVITAAGDSGPSACHTAGTAAPIAIGYSVNALAATPWNTALGVSAFGVPGPSTEATALWAWGHDEYPTNAYAGGGGSSVLYSGPDWQPIPPQLQQGPDAAAPHNRLLPDLALPTALDAANPGLAFCLSAPASSESCNVVRGGGSSAAAALFAGVAALIQQQNGAQGNMAPRLYALSRQPGIFEDVTQGSAQLSCTAGSPNCDADGLIGFTAAPGFDRATGLGTVNVGELLSKWASPQATGTATSNVTMSVMPTEPNSTYNPSATVALTATVASPNGGATPTGSVLFFNTSAAQNISSTPSTLDASGVATLQIERAFNVGGNEIIAIYSGDSTYAPAESSPPVNVNVQPSTTSMAVVPSATAVAPGQTVTVTATLTVGSPPEGTAVPTGMVTLDVDGLPSKTASLATTNNVTSATFSIVIPSSSTLATHALQAVYAGDSNYTASTSPAVSVTVSLSPTTTTVMPSTTTPATGSSLMVSASIASSIPVTANPTGTVNILLDTVSQGIVPVTAGTPSTASVTIPAIAAGAHVLQATYSGDSNYAASTSASVALTAAKGATTTTLTAIPGVLALGSKETFTASVAPTTAVTGTVYTLTGTVSFYDGGTTLLGTAAVSSNSASLTGIALASNVSHSITAVYSGDTNWLTSTSIALPLAATTIPVAVVLSSNLGSAISPGQALILAATVTPTATPAAGAEQNPTGNVIFYNGTAVIGTVAVTALPEGDSSEATLTLQTLPGGQDALSAFYAGDLYFDSATSNILGLAVEDFTITPSPSNPGTNLNIVQGTSGSAGFVINSVGGFNNTIQVVCAVPTQDDMNCTASPQQLTPPGTANFVVQTYLPGEQTSTTTVSRNNTVRWTRAAGGTALAVLTIFLLPQGRKARMFGGKAGRRLWIFMLLLVGLSGVGIGCTSSTAVNGNETPLGVATLKITATAYVDNTVVSHSVYLTVNVLAPASTQ